MAAEAQTQSAPSAAIWRAVALVFLPFSGGYFLSYLYRAVNAVIAPNLVEDLSLTAADLGLVSAAYFLAFAAFQVPLGVLLDRFGPRRVQAALLLIAALGALVFSLGQSIEMLILGRALIGLGVAGGLMASLKAIVMWFPADRWALVNGWFLATGGMGAMSATAPVEALLGVTDWRGIFQMLAGVTAVSASAIFLVVPEKPKAPDQPSLKSQFAVLGQIYRDPLFWRLAPMSIVAMGSNMAIHTLWAGPWFRDVGGHDRVGVAKHLLVLAIALTFGFIGAGLAADRLAKRGVDPVRTFGGGILLYTVAQVTIVLEINAHGYLSWVMLGLLSGMSVLVFAIFAEHFTPALTARANTALNVLVFSSAFATQYGVGAIIDLWPPAANGGYEPVAYQTAFGSITVLIVLTWIWFAVSPARPRRATDRPEDR